jgi:hypothetical protein
MRCEDEAVGQGVSDPVKIDSELSEKERDGRINVLRIDLGR